MPTVYPLDFSLPKSQLWYATNIIFYFLLAGADAHNVLPVFARICRNIFSATLWIFLFFKVAYRTTWHAISFSNKVSYFILM